MITVERIHSRTCTAEQAAAFMRNAWRYARVGNTHIRIHPPTSDVSIHPPGPVRYVATIEVLDSEVAVWGRADQDAVDAASELFGAVLA